MPEPHRTATEPLPAPASTVGERLGQKWPPDAPQAAQPPVVVLSGPTASGKSALALSLALAWRDEGVAAEIVNADSMLVYRGMDIGTAKPTVEERSLVAHHLIETQEIDEPASVALFQTQARGVIADLRARGTIPIVVGGSALYLRAITDVFDFPPTDPSVRARLEADLEALGPAALHARLTHLAPEAAHGILPGNGRRIVRALEVVELTGGFRPVLPPHTSAIDGVVHLGLDLPRPLMDRRIADRVEAMWEAGFVDEVRDLAARGLREAPTASRAIGYRQILAFLEGTMTEAEAKEETITRTRQFSRKQLSWWRRDPRITWIDADPAPDPRTIASLISADRLDATRGTTPTTPPGDDEESTR
ncbi:MAG: tRNA (adenosine(37)-N6)-dimethylallyltransferase MiaA [Propionibacteriaceae bacterium]|nr:tRNA (adenosine(37)-N6)-dimethylallyltransferase MiaA [Propionibacteriaceae bacterium]